MSTKGPSRRVYDEAYFAALEQGATKDQAKTIASEERRRFQAGERDAPPPRLPEIDRVKRERDAAIEALAMVMGTSELTAWQIVRLGMDDEEEELRDRIP